MAPIRLYIRSIFNFQSLLNKEHDTAVSSYLWKCISDGFSLKPDIIIQVLSSKDCHAVTGRYIPGTGSVRTHYHLRGKYQPASRYYYCSSPRYSQLSDIERAGEVWDLTPRTRRAHNLHLVSTAESHNPPPHHLSSRLDKKNT